jgi:ABC-type transport system substrate-binding protein
VCCGCAVIATLCLLGLPHREGQAMSHRSQYRILGSALLIALAVTLPVRTAAPAPVASKYAESPMLIETVKAGKLPPVDQRLPEKPFVVKPEQVGAYGGNWRMVAPNVDIAGLERTVNYENLVEWNLTWSGILPNVAERWEVNTDATAFTLHLRRGMKWSDGQPLPPTILCSGGRCSRTRG